jgi:hypothetical protein
VGERPAGGYDLAPVPLFCRHNRRTADCPICSRGTVLEPGAGAPRPRPRAAAGARARAPVGPPPAVRGPFGVAGPYFDDGEYEVRLERVPGGLRLAEWRGGSMRRRAPVLDPDDLPRLLRTATERDALGGREAERMLAAAAAHDGATPLGAAEARDGARRVGAAERDGPAAPERNGPGVAFGASPGRAGDLREELRVERLGERRLRFARWTLRPNHDWELHEAPVMLPAARFAEALEHAAEGGVLGAD